MKMKKALCTLLSIAMLNTLVSCGQKATNTPGSTSTPANSSTSTQEPVEAKTLVLTCTALDPKEVTDFNSWGPAVNAFKEYVEENSGGRYKVDVFYNFTYGSSEAEMWQMLADGEVDFFFGAGLSSVDSRFCWNKIPYLLKNYDQLLELYCDPDSEGFALQSRLFEENGVKMLAQNPGLFRHIMSTKKLIKVPGDLADETFRSYQDAIHTAFFGGLGNIVIMGFSDLYTSMQNGMITATDQQMPTYVGNTFYEIAPYYSFVGTQNTSYSMLMNLDAFNGYSAEDQELFTKAAQYCAEVEYEQTQYWDDKTNEYLDSKGVTYYYPTDEELQQWVDYADSMKDTWIDIVGQDIYDEAYRIFGEWDS